jgi:hypothetical protein
VQLHTVSPHRAEGASPPSLRCSYSKNAVTLNILAVTLNILAVTLNILAVTLNILAVTLNILAVTDTKLMKLGQIRMKLGEMRFAGRRVIPTGLFGEGTRSIPSVGAACKLELVSQSRLKPHVVKIDQISTEIGP